MVRRVVQAKMVISPTVPTRREIAYYIFFAALVVSSIALVVGVLWMLLPPPPPTRVLVGSANDFPLNPQPYRILIEGKSFFLVRTDDLTQLIEPIVVASGYGQCALKWVPVNNRFEDPCWGSKFDLRGQYLSGPPRRVRIYPVEIEDGRIWVNWSEALFDGYRAQSVTPSH